MRPEWYAYDVHTVVTAEDEMIGLGSQGRKSEETIRWTDQQIWLPSASVSVVHRCRSLLLSFSICYLGILGLERAISCILARTSHQRTTSEKRTKVLLPKCPLFGGSTVYICMAPKEWVQADKDMSSFFSWHVLTHDYNLDINLGLKTLD